MTHCCRGRVELTPETFDPVDAHFLKEAEDELLKRMKERGCLFKHKKYRELIIVDYTPSTKAQIRRDFADISQKYAGCAAQMVRDKLHLENEVSGPKKDLETYEQKIKTIEAQHEGDIAKVHCENAILKRDVKDLGRDLAEALKKVEKLQRKLGAR